ncbi:MAG: hypothetical protein GY834_10395 [Bacteroidetes bacterium]|nr:hypothetical protein [Bacteroidota bacterium]
MNELTLIIIGINILVYSVVTLIQRAQIKKTKEINDSMKDYMEIFDINKVKEYVRMQEETIGLKAIHLISSEIKLNKTIQDTVDKTHELAHKEYMEMLGKKHIELRDFTIKVLLALPESEVENILDKYLIENKSLLKELISSVKKNTNNN